MSARSRFLGFILLLVGVHAAHAEDDPVGHLLARETAPAGVVFEVVSGDGRALETALPKIQQATRRLRARFPGLEVAVVSHGREQFALLESAAEAEAETHARVRSLVDEKIPVEVCGTHAGWYGKTPGDFPDFVHVAESGPARISDYRAMGYVLVLIEP